jgi:hypothetical protein
MPFGHCLNHILMAWTSSPIDDSDIASDGTECNEDCLEFTAHSNLRMSPVTRSLGIYIVHPVYVSTSR